MGERWRTGSIFASVAAACAWSAAAGAAPPAGPYFPPALGEHRWVCDYGDGPRPIEIIDELNNHWFSGQLRAAGERSFYVASLQPHGADQVSLRFTWLRSFHRPVVIRIERKGAAYRLIAKELSGAGGYAPGRVAEHIGRALTRDEVRRLQAVMARTRVFDIAIKDCDVGIDGAEWIIEGVDEHGYHFVERFMPGSGAVRELGLFLIGLTGWEEDPVY